MKHIYITGDMHGEKERFFSSTYGIADTLSHGDYLIIVGDCKFVFDDSLVEKEEAVLDELAQLPYTILFCDGNHENFDRLLAYPQKKWKGGQVHQLRPNILHLMRGQIFTIEQHTFFVMGGGYSFGMNPCIEGKNWWPAETPNAMEYHTALNSLQDHNNTVDYILTHTAPNETMRVVAPEYASDLLNHFFD